ANLVIVTVKSYDTETAAGTALELLEKDGIVLTLQNGLGNAEVLSAVLGPQRVAAGVTTFGGYRKAPGNVVWGGEGKVVFGPWGGSVDLEPVRTLFEKSRMNPVLLDDPRPAIWGKIVINAAVNPAAALSRLCNGALIANDQSRELMKNVAWEAVRAAGISGVDIDPEASWRNLVETLQRTAANRPSMLQDVEAGRKTEIESILAPILKAGETEGEAFPFTRALYSLLCAVEQERLAAWGGSDA
ncbi:MAG: 2-dehydropantoate 2-reductase, partial [Synergistota bacterium]|nr:2-dehydropantoate 2-reductase [Synergistota bacterium]